MLRKLKEDYKYLLFFFILLVITLLIATVTFKPNDFTLNFPTQNLFGMITYSVTIIFGIIGFFILKNVDKEDVKLHKIFVSIVIPLGILYCLANPLGKVPDEDHHARKAIAISQGNFFSKADKNGDAYEPINAKISELVTRSTSSYEDAYNRIKAEETDEKIDMWYTTMALYSPICHLPQAFGFFITRIFGANVVVQCYAARLVNMLVAIFFMYEAIKLIPFKKHIIMFLGLLPITLNEFASMSSDALAISISIFYISYILYLKYDKTKKIINKKDIVILTVSSIVIALNKIVYLPLCLLLFMLPKEKLGSLKRKNIIAGVIFGISTILNLVWLIYCSRFLVTFNPGVNSAEQVKYILVNPIRYALVCFRTMNVYNQTFIMSLCGEGLGSYNAQASVLYVFPCLLLFATLFFANDDKEREEFDIFSKLYMLAIFISIVVLIYTSIYVQWTPVGYPMVFGIQARYFLPIILLLAIVLDNKILVFNKKFSNRYLLTFMIFFNLNALSCILYTYMNCIIEYYIK